MQEKVDLPTLFVEGALGGAELVRAAQARAFADRGRSMNASDLLNALSGVVAANWSV